MHVAPRAVQSSRYSKPDEFTAAHRLLRGDGFGHVLHARRSVSDEYFKIFFSRNGCKNARLGIIASKRTLPSAVARNRAKRAIREVFRRHRVKICTVDMVVMLRRAPQQRVMQDANLETLFSKVESRCAE